MAGSGWIKLHRQFLKWEWWEDHNTTRLFTYFLIKANHALKKWQGVAINSGQFVSSIHKMSEETGLSHQQVRTSIKKLKSTNEITSQATSRYTMLTVCNWGIYQNDKKESNEANNEQDNKPITNEQQTDNKPITTNKNKENQKNQKEKPKQRPVKKFSVKDINLPYPSKEFLEAWSGLMEVRKEKKAVNSETAIKLLITKLNKIAPSESEAIRQLNRATENSWKTVYPDNGFGSNSKNRQHEREKFSFPEGEEINNEM